MNPKNDYAELCKTDCPSWWGCEKRGCYASAQQAYANHRPEKQERIQDEVSTDMRQVYPEIQGKQRNYQDEGV